MFVDMVERDEEVRSIRLEELAAVAGALEAGLPRDEVLAGAGLSAAAWEAARERWMSRLAAQAARGQLRSSRRYLELVAAQKRRAEEKARGARRKLEGPMPVAPAARIAPLQGAPRDGATPPPAAGVSDEGAARSPWARLNAAAPLPGVVQPSPLPPAVPSPLPPVMPSPLPPAVPSASLLPTVPSPLPMPRLERPSTAPRARMTLLGTTPLPGRDALPFRQDVSSAPAVEGTTASPADSPEMDMTAIGTVGAPEADRALPFSGTAPLPPLDAALPFSRPAPVPPADNALPFARPAPVPPADNALPFARPAPVPPADNALPFARPAPVPPADNALPFSRPASSPPAANPLPFSQPAPVPAADNALPFSRPASSPPAAHALPFSRPTRSPPADNALPFARPGQSPAPSRPARGEIAPQPPQIPTGSWALPFLQPSAAEPSASPSPAEPAAQAHAGMEDDEAMRRVERISLARYARLCADLRDHPNLIPQIQSHYGLTPQSWIALHRIWHERLESDPALKAQWQALIDQSAQG
ncbi:hypothetical protein sce3119 [Sorangium cellulosum So ce56]|uniref:Uncharacterized protein n=1 Tax=Sorangium cellulosum (strain So ce56) TaxID=448385 RepID=A9GIK2_SORC5|nr:hypothetical protein [Sorangium cellulosum]CAN93278.1 hypothetical protein sce3119 [Sorangium cellulosum So ce56]